MNDRTKLTDPASDSVQTDLTSVTAVVLTHRRPRLASAVVRSLIDVEGLAPERVVVVVNGSGGLDDHRLEAAVKTVRLPRNVGPAGGFAAGMELAFAVPSTQWAYLCEDDVGLFPLPAPRLAGVVARASSVDPPYGLPVGAVVAYGRRFVGRGAHTVNVVPGPDAPADFVPVDVASWGATLLSRSVFDAGVLPEPDWFFGLEDFDFFCRVRQAGFEVLIDGISARAVAAQQTSQGRDEAIAGQRPTDAQEPWRLYYHARNSVLFARRHGRPSWHLWHLAFSVRHLQNATSWVERRAIVHGLWDGARGRKGERPGYGGGVAELPAPDGTTDPTAASHE